MTLLEKQAIFLNFCRYVILDHNRFKKFRQFEPHKTASERLNAGWCRCTQCLMQDGKYYHVKQYYEEPPSDCHYHLEILVNGENADIEVLKELLKKHQGTENRTFANNQYIMPANLDECQYLDCNKCMYFNRLTDRQKGGFQAISCPLQFQFIDDEQERK